MITILSILVAYTAVLGAIGIAFDEYTSSKGKTLRCRCEDCK